ncbi:hypothetical protein BGZ46_007665 [Entomortierella lignicola]|nr:hypothetical protein BGZ46_007665 [Entomortierella lignicola]
MRRLSGQCNASLRTDKLTTEPGNTASNESTNHDQGSSKPDVASTATVTTTVTTTTTAIATEDLVKKFKLKPSAEVGIRARMLERQRKQAEEAEVLKAEMEINSGKEKINRLFETLQLGSGASSTEGSKATGNTDSEPAKTTNISNSWKFLFDESELNEKKVTEGSAEIEDKETLDKIPGASNLFPSLSEYQSPPPTSNPSPSTLPIDTNPAPRHTGAERWKDPRMKGSERDAFKALFSSLFEQKTPEKQEASPGEKMQSLFSNFSRTGLDQSRENTKETESKSSPFTSPSEDFSLSATESEREAEDPMQVLRRQLENLSKRAEPIYLDKKPKTSPFRVMESTVTPQDWLNQDPTMPQENTLFNAIKEENKVSIRMRKELEEKLGDVVQVKQFVDDLIAPFVEPQSELLSSNTVKPSSASLDSLLAHAILAISSTRLETESSKVNTEKMKASDEPQTLRSLHPYLGQALVENTRRQGLPVFIRAVRTESYKALLKSRWDAWHDGPGCLEILKEMQRNGALVDSETKSMVQNMRSELKASKALSSSDLASATSKDQLQQYGWGYEEQQASIVEMLNIISVASEDGDNDYNVKQWVKRPQSNK